MNQAKRVTFGSQQTAYFAAAAPPSSSTDNAIVDVHQTSASSWYSDSELRQSRNEARKCILSLQERLNQEGDHRSSISIDTLKIPCPDDPSQILCLRGIEKYADAAAKFAGQKRHVGSVLRQQSLDNKEEHVALVSRTLSQPFKDVARYYAVKSAEEQEAVRKEEAEQMDVAEAIFLFLASQPQHEKIHKSTSSSSSPIIMSHHDGRSTPPEMVSTTRKRSREDHESDSHDDPSSCGSFNCEKGALQTLVPRRNIKPCVRVISE